MAVILGSLRGSTAPLTGGLETRATRAGMPLRSMAAKRQGWVRRWFGAQMAASTRAVMASRGTAVPA